MDIESGRCEQNCMLTYVTCNGAHSRGYHYLMTGKPSPYTFHHKGQLGLAIPPGLANRIPARLHDWSYARVRSHANGVVGFNK